MKKLAMVMASLALATGMAAAVMPQKAEAATPCNKQVLRKGSKNLCVGKLQMMLNIATRSNLDNDDIFGSKTQKAVKAWQDSKELKQDGVVGEKTWKTLCNHRIIDEKTKKVSQSQPFYNIMVRDTCAPDQGGITSRL